MNKELKEINNFILMEFGRIRDGLVITENVIKESIVKKTFDNTPIVYNEGNHRRAIGYVIPNTARIDNTYVVADVMSWEDFGDRDRFDEWTILFDNNKTPNYIKSYCCELYKVVNTHERK